ncbi:DMT family transporter [Mesorhizobium xinjiangense]|uniref:DMT family transporter n=1 Tax=Mesorhizobium xinjiangense TaxID=2678685 RepID=UPI0012EDE509|nr:DMT family transporter [Mesorhizobium xinjiangense]
MSSLTRAVPAVFVLLWATGFIGARYAMPWSEPFSFLAVRFALAFLLLAVIVRFVRRDPVNVRAALHAAIAGMLMHGVYLGGVFWAIDNGLPAGFSALIVGLQPMITALMAGAALGEQVSARQWAGLAVGLAGVAAVLSPALGTIGSGVTAATLAAGLVAVLAMSAGTIWQKRFVSGIGLVHGTLYQYLGAAVLMALGSLAFETRQYTLTGELVFALVWLVVVLSLGAVFLLMYLIREGEVSRVASLFYLVPGTTAVMAWLLFGERLGPIQIAGMAAATLGVALATRQRPTRARASR